MVMSFGSFLSVRACMFATRCPMVCAVREHTNLTNCGKVRGPNSGRVLIRDTSNFSPFFQAAVSCS